MYYDRLFDKFAFWTRYLFLLDYLLDKEIEYIKDYIKQNPLECVK